MAVTAPAAPTYTVTARPDQGTVRIDVTTTSNASDGQQFVEVQIEAPGTIPGWRTLRWGSGIEADGTTVTIVDDEAPTQRGLKYRVRATQSDGTTTAHSAWVSSQPSVVLRTTTWFLSAPLMPAYRLRLWVPSADRSTTRVQPKTSVQVPGRRFAVQMYGTRQARSGSFTFETRTKSEWELLNLMLDAQTPLYVQQPDGESWYMSAGTMTDTLVASAGWMTKPRHAVSIAYEETSAP